jgi:hypothetical protein
MSSAYRFRALLYSVGINRCVDVPANVSRALGGAALIPVRGAIARWRFESTLTPRGRGRHRLFIHSRIWRPLGLERGDAVTVTVRAGRAPSTPPLPEALQTALARRPLAARAFADLTAAMQREVLRRLAAAKRPATLARRIRVGLHRLEQRYEERAARVGRGRRRTLRSSGSRRDKR